MPTTLERIRDALLRPMTRRRDLDADLNAAAVLAVGELELRRLMPDYLDKFHLVLANPKSPTVIFLDQHPHESYRACRIVQRSLAFELKEQVAKNLEALKPESSGGIDAVHVAVCGLNDDFLVLYRKKLLAFIQQHMGWPLQTIPSKIAKLLAKHNHPETSGVQTLDVRRDYAMMGSTFTLGSLLMNARRDLCAACEAEPTAERKLKICGRCLKVSYCSAECQRAHWAEEHKVQCKMLQELESSSSSLQPGQTTAVASSKTWADYFEACTL
jgi:hypothetical protein